MPTVTGRSWIWAQSWIWAFGGVAVAVLGAALLGQGGAMGLLGALLVVAGVAGIARQGLRLTGDDGDLASGPPPAAAKDRTDHLWVSTMSASAQWAAGVAMGVLALLGLFLVSRSADGMFTVFGGLLFLFGIAAIIVLVHRATDYGHGEASSDDQTA